MIASKPFRYDLELVFRRSLRRTNRRLLIFGIVAEIVMAVLAGILVMNLGSLVEAAAIVLFVPTYLGLIHVVGVRSVRKQLRDLENHFDVERTISFDEDTLAWTPALGGRSEMPWTEVIGRERVESTNIVWIPEQQGVFVPDAAWEPADLAKWQARIARLPQFTP